MSYHRGGKVWVDGNGCGWIALENDWVGDTLHEDLVSENGLIGVDFQLVDYRVRASMGGYVRHKNGWLFFLSGQSIKLQNLDESSIYLRGDFNNWEFSEEYQLARTENGVGLWLRDEIFDHFEHCEFKYYSKDGKWIEPNENFPVYPKEGSSIRNGWFDKKRTGKDLFSFRVIDTQGAKGSQRWVEKRPPGKFGFSLNKTSSKFRIFAPRAQRVELLLFDKPEKGDKEILPMHYSNDGSWSFSDSVNLTGKYYNFLITQRDKVGRLYSKEILDPYALATFGRNGPGIALDRTISTRKRKFVPPSIQDAIVVEAHLRDLLARASHCLSESERLQFCGLSKWLLSEECYLKNLGANVVELQPIQEFDAKTKDEYHWGYMPVNFFSPASVYGNRSDDGSVIEAFTELVNSFHEVGYAVVLDVVYNHVGVPPHLIHLDKEIYFSTDTDGTLTNFSGCGNDLRCDSEPVKKLILDSLTYWVETFDVDGFRFDLGELLGFELLAEIESELKRIKPGILLFAEPWSFRGRLPLEMNQTNYALWSDVCREELLNYAKNQSNEDLVIELLTQGLDRQNISPYQSVNYLESHDDYSLVDRFRGLEIWQDQNVVPDEVVHRIMVAMGLLMIAPGVPMISAGQDFLRHKKGIRNTYLLGGINEIDYNLEKKYGEESQFIRRLIKLRLSAAGRRCRQAQSEEWVLHSFPSSQISVIVFGWESTKTGEKSLITANPSLERVNIDLPESWKQNQQLLVSYRSEDTELLSVSPLSFSWFSKP